MQILWNKTIVYCQCLYIVLIIPYKNCYTNIFYQGGLYIAFAINFTVCTSVRAASESATATMATAD